MVSLDILFPSSWYFVSSLYIAFYCVLLFLVTNHPVAGAAHPVPGMRCSVAGVVGDMVAVVPVCCGRGDHLRQTNSPWTGCSSRCGD